MLMDDERLSVVTEETDSVTIDDAIDAINKHMGVMSSAVYDNGKITIEVKNLDILRAAIEMSLKHSRGEC